MRSRCTLEALPWGPNGCKDVIKTDRCVLWPLPFGGSPLCFQAMYGEQRLWFFFWSLTFVKYLKRFSMRFCAREKCHRRLPLVPHCWSMKKPSSITACMAETGRVWIIIDESSRRQGTLVGKLFFSATQNESIYSNNWAWLITWAQHKWIVFWTGGWEHGQLFSSPKRLSWWPKNEMQDIKITNITERTSNLVSEKKVWKKSLMMSLTIQKNVGT